MRGSPGTSKAGGSAGTCLQSQGFVGLRRTRPRNQPSLCRDAKKFGLYRNLLHKQHRAREVWGSRSWHSDGRKQAGPGGQSWAWGGPGRGLSSLGLDLG